MIQRFWSKPSRTARCFVLALLLGGAAYGLSQLWWIYHAKRFQELRAGVFYRTGQPTEMGVRYLASDKGIRTIVRLQSFNPTLKRGIFDPGQPSGVTEIDFARQLGLSYRAWPLGDEACWPWPAPWHLEQFFKLIDDPANHPVLVHCQGGRHRTGTMSALFRLEYDRWPVERVLEEMYSYQFGPRVPVQEHNLRTYFPRPRPDTASWERLRARFAPVLKSAPSDYESLVRQLRSNRGEAVDAAARDALLTREPFSLCMAQRLIDAPDDPLAEIATQYAAEVLTADESNPIERSIAAALVADFGSSDQQAALLELLVAEPKSGPVSERYAAIVRGVTNRYTGNRLAYLRPLLGDLRKRPEPEAVGLRYCDTAVARLTSIVDETFYDRKQANSWDSGRDKALAWFADHTEETQLSHLLPPTGKDMIRVIRAENLVDERQLQ
jgi:tyrosine-protein phosphatase SIW14